MKGFPLWEISTHIKNSNSNTDKKKGSDIKPDLTFKKYGLLPEIVHVLEESLKIHSPSPI